MSEPQKQIIAIGGGGFYRDPENLVLEQYIIRQTGAAEPRVAFIPTASGEPDHYDVQLLRVVFEDWVPAVGADVF